MGCLKSGWRLNRLGERRGAFEKSIAGGMEEIVGWISRASLDSAFLSKICGYFFLRRAIVTLADYVFWALYSYIVVQELQLQEEK